MSQSLHPAFRVVRASTEASPKACCMVAWETTATSLLQFVDLPLTASLALYKWIAKWIDRTCYRQQKDCNARHSPFAINVVLGGAFACVLIDVVCDVDAGVLGLLLSCIMGAMFGHLARPGVLALQAGDTHDVHRAPVTSHSTADTCSRPKKRCASVAPAAVRMAATRQMCRTIQADDIVRCLTPLRCDKALASRLAKKTYGCISRLIPEADVQAIPGGNVAMLAARGLQPEVDVVVTVAPEILFKRWQEHSSKHSRRHADKQPFQSPGCLVKKATKFFSQKLTFAVYWRSQLSSADCKVVLTVNPDHGLSPHLIYINFHVNAPYQLRMYALASTSCTQRKPLMALVSHWVRQRCISNISRGQLTKYAWAALVLYFCRERPQVCTGVENIVEIFHKFVTFYADLFFQRIESAICFTTVVKMPPATVHLLYIEDPLETASNLAEKTTVDGFARVKEELQRAQDILGGRIAGDLFEKWEFRS